MSNVERRGNRTERLFAMILLLQNQPNMTSLDLANHFGVSRRTIFRDLRALSDSGVPLTYSDRGGYEILEGYRLPPLMLTAREAATLLVGTRFMKLQSDASLREDADDVAMKIRTVLPREVRQYVDHLLENTVLDPYWTLSEKEDSDTSGRWYMLSEAVARRRKVIMEYFVPARDEITQRTIDPLGLVYYSDHWNLIAFDHLRDEIRNFRLDRIRELFSLSERFERPEGFDLKKFLDQEGVRLTQSVVKLRFRKSVYERAKRGIPARVEKEIPDGDDITAEFEFDNLEYLATWLFRFGPSVTVDAPEALRKLHAKGAREVLATYT